MKSASTIPFKTLIVVVMLLLATGGVIGSLVTAAQQEAPAAGSTAHSFVGMPPAPGATEGNVTDLGQ